MCGVAFSPAGGVANSSARIRVTELPSPPGSCSFSFDPSRRQRWRCPAELLRTVVALLFASPIAGTPWRGCKARCANQAPHSVLVPDRPRRGRHGLLSTGACLAIPAREPSAGRDRSLDPAPAALAPRPPDWRAAATPLAGSGYRGL